MDQHPIISSFHLSSNDTRPAPRPPRHKDKSDAYQRDQEANEHKRRNRIESRPDIVALVVHELVVSTSEDRRVLFKQLVNSARLTRNKQKHENELTIPPAK